MRLPNEKFLALGLVLALAACGGEGERVAPSAPVAPQGPAADYPMVVGAPFTVDGVLYTPADTLNYDEVGRVAADPAGGSAISGEHRTLPLPSYVEVTSLETGRTILVRLERRGPMTGKSLIGLSPGALEQLGASAGTPVRVRRVNPPEQERAILRRGARAPERMDTPMSLVAVLRRKLPDGGSAPVDPAKQAAAPPAKAPAIAGKIPVPPAPAPKEASPPKQAVAPVAQPKPPAPPAPSPEKAQKGHFVVQAGAFSVEANAKKVAARIGGTVDRPGKLYRVRTGPFVTREEANASLAKVKGAGYSGARIYSVD
ncbi:MAG: SPOR domain-containing protein [Novosphingobium sp.]|nr:SPOR domain-containing protein [Novosphingobium sp.]